MIFIGYLSLVAALLCALYALISSIIGWRTRSDQWFRTAARTLHVITGLLTIAVFSLLILLLQRDFRVAYVAAYTNRALPVGYVFSALWAGQQGSLLFWGWLLALCSSFFIWKQHGVSDLKVAERQTGRAQKLADPTPYLERFALYASFAGVLGFFALVLLVMANPFTRLPMLPADGNGLNPLLQNFYMAIHPPILFMGYAGFIVPFALALTALCTGTISAGWLKTIRQWALGAWYLLGIGIILGAHWAYLELGWGGYWAWDPVENASLIPWLTGTALLHSLAVQRRKGMAKLWTLFLAVLTFALCIFATFVTRSGVLNSVHAFGQSAIGLYFLGFLTIVALIAAGLLMARWKTFRSVAPISDLLSKESSFLLANQLLIGLGAAVMYGTLYPFFFEILTGRKITIETVFFNRISVPVGLLILALIGICQRLSWQKSPPGTAARRFMLPVGLSVAAAIILFAAGVRDFLTVITSGLGLFVVFTMLVGIVGTLRQRLHRKTPEDKLSTILNATFWAQKRLYAAYIFHLGVAIVYAGIAVSSAYKVQQDVTLTPGESVLVGDVRFQYGALHMAQDAQKATVWADMTVYRGEQAIAALTPQKRFYGQGQNEQMTTEIGLYSSLQRDIYVILAGWQEDHSAAFTIILHPMILWIWVGGFFVFTLGMLTAMLPVRSAHRYRAEPEEMADT